MDFRKNELQFGTVRSVDGSKVIIKAINLKKEIGSLTYHVEVGSFVNCGSIYHGDTICIITRVYIEEVERRDASITTNQIVELDIVGSSNEIGKLSRGIDQLPHISSNSYLLTGDQINHLLGISENNQTNELPNKYFKVGKRSMRGAGDVYFDLDKFLGRHVAIVGTTGSGKSSTVANIVQSILRDYPQPRVVFFDIHNEYPNAFTGEWENKANCINWSDFKLPYWFLDLDEFIAVYYPEAGGTQRMYLKDILESLKRDSEDDADLKIKISVDSPIYFNFVELITQIQALSDAQSTASKKEPFDKMLLKIQSKYNDSRFEFLNENSEKDKSLSSYFEFLLGLVPSNPTFISVLDLSGLPAEIRTVCVGVLTRLFFDFKYWDMDSENLPLALVLEEAHTYIPEDNSAKYSLCLERVEKVAKEGRKYGLSLIVVTQRPSNVSSTVLSQCGTFISLRLTNDLDQNKIKRLLPDSLGEQANILSTLRDGEALVTGDAMMLPGRVRFDEPNPRPKSNDVRFHKSWTEGPPAGYDAKKITTAWNIRQKNI